jgi:hypothetical protein
MGYHLLYHLKHLLIKKEFKFFVDNLLTHFIWFIRLQSKLPFIVPRLKHSKFYKFIKQSASTLSILFSSMFHWIMYLKLSASG